MAFETESEAKSHSEKVLKVLGGGWTAKVWENLGWCCSWQFGSVYLGYSTYNGRYFCLIGAPGSGVGHMDFSGCEDSSNDPRKSIIAACKYAEQIFDMEWEPIMQSITEVVESASLYEKEAE